MNVRNTAGLLLIVAGLVLIFLRARKKGDVAFFSGVGAILEKDLTYGVGAFLVAVGAVMIAPDLKDVLLA